MDARIPGVLPIVTLSPWTAENPKVAWAIAGVGFPTVDTRCCAACQEEKTIKGVWFLVSQAGGPADGPGSDFLCEDCFNEQAGGLRGAQVQRDGEHRRGTPAG